MNLRESLRAWGNRKCPKLRCREATGRVRRGLTRTQRCACRRQGSIGADGRSGFVEAAQFVSDRDPNFLRGGIDGERIDLRPDAPRIIVRIRREQLVMTGCRGEFVQGDLIACEAEAIESAHRGLGQPLSRTIQTRLMRGLILHRSTVPGATTSFVDPIAAPSTTSGSRSSKLGTLYRVVRR